MSEEPTEKVEVEEPAQDAEKLTPQEEPFDAERAKALIDKLRGEIKDLKPKAKMAEELSEAEKKRKEAEMTELDRLTKQLEDAQAELKRSKLEILKQAAAAKHNLPAELASRLQGDTPEELDEDAEKLAKLIPKTPAPHVGPTNPGGTASGGAETLEAKRARLGLR